MYLGNTFLIERLVLQTNVAATVPELSAASTADAQSFSIFSIAAAACSGPPFPIAARVPG